MKYLVVDDEDAAARSIRLAIARLGDEVRCASNGLEALQAIENFEPDVVTMDMSMPEMDGLACIETMLRERPHTRIIVISAIADKPLAVEAVKRGAAGFLLKPFSVQLLREEIRELFA